MNYPEIRLPFEKPSYSKEAICQLLSQILPPNAFFDASYKKYLPHISWSPLTPPPCHISFFLLCKLREDAFRYFYEMIRKWLIPKKQLNILLQFAADFMMPEISSDYFTVGQLVIFVQQKNDFALIQKNLPRLESELKRGIASPYAAARILELKGISNDEKSSLIQESISNLIKRVPQNFDYDLLSEMQLFLALCKEEFKQLRECKHIARIICTLYLFRKALKLSYDIFPERRYISVKLIGARLARKRRVLGIAVGLSFLHPDEVFEAHHVLHAVKTIIPDAQKVEGSYYGDHRQQDPIGTLYLEVEKAAGFTSEEEKKLKELLPQECKLRIQQKLSPIFMPQNEEVVMRYIVTLAGELKYVNDYPQVIIDFTRQTNEKLEFLVIVLRVKKEKTLPLGYLFELRPTGLEFVFDRTKIVGSLRAKYQKEATVFYLCMHKGSSLRQDQSVDLYKARREVAAELKRVIGEFRDYNGGTLTKETESFHELHNELGNLAEENGFLLENFFFSLSPPDKRSIMPPAALKKLFVMILEAEIEGVSKEEVYQIRMAEDKLNFYLLVTSIDGSFAPLVNKKLESYTQGEIASAALMRMEFPCVGIICHHFTPAQTRQLWMDIEEAMQSHAFQKKNSLSF